MLGLRRQPQRVVPDRRRHGVLGFRSVEAEEQGRTARTCGSEIAAPPPDDLPNQLRAIAGRRKRPVLHGRRLGGRSVGQLDPEDQQNGPPAVLAPLDFFRGGEPAFISLPILADDVGAAAPGPTSAGVALGQDRLRFQAAQPRSATR